MGGTRTPGYTAPVSVGLLLIIIVASYTVVRIGALALELTGTEQGSARFQALSAFTNSGFTTRESEEVVTHPIRRRIIAILIVLGNAGMVTTIGTFASSMMEGDVKRIALNVGVIAVGLFVLSRLARWRRLSQRLGEGVQRWLARRYDFDAPTAEGLLRLGRGFRLARLVLHPQSPAAGHQLKDLNLKEKQVQVLAIEREGSYLPVPGGDATLQPGDRLIVYGKQSTVNRAFHPDATVPIKVSTPAARPPPGPAPTDST